jgi:glutathione S-transferase
MADSTETAHTPGTWRLIYFNAPNRGEQVRQLFVLSKTPFTDARLIYPRGLDPFKKAAMGDASPLLGTDLCPAVTAPDGTHCVETSEVMRFVGQRVGMAPAAGSAEDETAMEMCLLAQDVMNVVFYGLLKQMCVKKIAGFAARLLNGSEPAYLEKPAQKLTEVVTKIEATLDRSGGPYILGAEPCYGDVSIFAILNEVLAFSCFDKSALLSERPKLAALLDDMGGKMSSWIDFRVREYQLGIKSTVDYFAATNTPIPWNKKKGASSNVSVRTDPSCLGARQ